MDVRPYRVNFEYTETHQGSVFIAAEDAEKAKAGAAVLLEVQGQPYSSATIVAAEEVKNEDHVLQ